MSEMAIGPLDSICNNHAAFNKTEPPGILSQFRICTEFLRGTRDINTLKIISKNGIPGQKYFS